MSEFEQTVTIPAIGLLIRTGPYQQRSARSQLDLALVAASLEKPLQIYFLGQAVLQLLQRRELVSAKLPAGYKAWASLPEMTDVEVFAEPLWLERLQCCHIKLMLQPQALELMHMRVRWQSCEKLLVL